MTKLTLLGIAFIAAAGGCDEDVLDEVDRTPGCRMPFTEYSVGESFEELDLEVRQANCGKRPSVTYIYGTCHATGDMGCAPPLEVQSWSIRDRKPSRAAAGHDVELRRGKVTVVVFAESDRLASAAVRALRPASRP